VDQCFGPGGWSYATFEEDMVARGMTPKDGVAAEVYPVMTEARRCSLTKP
jgi:hypothetical protein